MDNFDQLNPLEGEDSSRSDEQDTLSGHQFIDLKDSTELSSEIQEIFAQASEYLKENPVLNADIRRLGERVLEVIEYPKSVTLFGTTKKTLDKGELKRTHSLEGYEFTRNGPGVEILKVSVLSLKDNPNATEYVQSIEDNYQFNNDKALEKINFSMQNVEDRRNLDVSFFDQSRIYRDRATREASKTIEEVVFSFEDSDERKICAVVVKEALGGIYLSLMDFRNPDRAKMFVTERPILLENFDKQRFSLLKKELSRRFKGMKHDLD